MHDRGFFGEGPIIAPPRDDAPALSATGFVMCPLAFQAGFRDNDEIQQIYRLAYEWARAALNPSWYDRLFRVPCN
jgi:hypothetical protein